MSCDGAGVRALSVLMMAGVVVVAGCAAPAEEQEPPPRTSPTVADAAEEQELEPAWALLASSIEERGVFVRPGRIGAGPISDAPFGGYVIDDVIVTTVRTDVNSSEYTSPQVPEQILVALNADDGEVRWTQPVQGALACAEDVIDGLLPCLVGGDPYEPGTGMSPAPSPSTELRYFRISDGEVAASVPAERAREVAVHDGAVFLAWQDPYDEPERSATITRGNVSDPESDWRVAFPLPEECATGVQGFWIEITDGLLYFRGEQAFVVRTEDGERTPDEALYSAASVPGHGFIADLCETEEASAVFTSEGEEVARHVRPDVVSVVSRSGDADEPVYIVNGAAIHDFETGEQLWTRDPRFFWVLGLVGDLALSSGSTPGGPTLGLDARTGDERWSAPFGEFGWVVGALNGEMVTRGHGPSEVAGVNLDNGDRTWSFPVPEAARIDLTDDGILASTQEELRLYRID